MTGAQDLLSNKTITVKCIRVQSCHVGVSDAVRFKVTPSLDKSMTII